MRVFTVNLFKLGYTFEIFHNQMLLGKNSNSGFFFSIWRVRGHFLCWSHLGWFMRPQTPGGFSLLQGPRWLHWHIGQLVLVVGWEASVLHGVSQSPKSYTGFLTSWWSNFHTSLLPNSIGQSKSRGHAPILNGRRNWLPLWLGVPLQRGMHIGMGGNLRSLYNTPKSFGPVV